MPHDPQRFVLLLDEYIGFISDLPADTEFNGHFMLEDKINAEGKALGLGTVFDRSEHWQSPDGVASFTVPANASDEVWDKIEKTFGDIEVKDHGSEIRLTVYRPHRMGHTTFYDLPLRGFRNNDNLPQKDRTQLIAALREWQRAARTNTAEPAAPSADSGPAAELRKLAAAIRQCGEKYWKNADLAEELAGANLVEATKLGAFAGAEYVELRHLVNLPVTPKEIRCAPGDVPLMDALGTPMERAVYWLLSKKKLGNRVASRSDLWFPDAYDAVADVIETEAAKLRAIAKGIKQAAPMPADAEPQGVGNAGKAKTSHSADFTFVNWYGTEYTFALGVQSSAVKALWGEWESTGLGLHQDTIRNAVDPERDGFRMDKAFRNHPAFGTMIQKTGDGKYKLARPVAGKAPDPKAKKSAGIPAKARRKPR